MFYIASTLRLPFGQARRRFRDADEPHPRSAVECARDRNKKVSKAAGFLHVHSGCTAATLRFGMCETFGIQRRTDQSLANPREHLDTAHIRRLLGRDIHRPWFLYSAGPWSKARLSTHTSGDELTTLADHDIARLGHRRGGCFPQSTKGSVGRSLENVQKAGAHETKRYRPRRCRRRSERLCLAGRAGGL